MSTTETPTRSYLFTEKDLERLERLQRYLGGLEQITDVQIAGTICEVDLDNFSALLATAHEMAESLYCDIQEAGTYAVRESTSESGGGPHEEPS